MNRKVLAMLLFIVLLVSAALAEETRITREYFEDLDRESRVEDIVEDAGNYGIEGSGILYYVWRLNDGSKAKVVFDSQGRIAMIYIVSEDKSERIYKRGYLKTESDTDRSADAETDMAEAIREMKQAIGEKLPASGRMFFPDPTRPDVELFDITGDGCADLFKCVTWGSGMVRTDLVVYDPAGKELYVLDGYNYDYLIDRVEEDRIVIVMEGPHGYGDPVTRTYGTVILEDGELRFLADAGQSEKND